MTLRMFFGDVLLFLFNPAFVHMLIIPNSECDFAETLTNRQMISFENPNWPATYMAGSSCRWTFDCPIWYACRLRCLDIGLPQTDDCYMDKLLVSASGSAQLESAEVFCGRTEINFRSIGSRMTLALVASPLSPGGRFRCTIRSEPWTQPWFISPCTANPLELEKLRATKAEEKGETIKKIITSARANHISDKVPQHIHADVPHTGLLQSRTLYTVYEPERAPHAKNAEAEYSHAKHENVSSHAEHVLVVSPLPKDNKTQTQSTVDFELLYNDNIQAGPAYQDYAKVSALKPKEVRARQSKVESKHADSLNALLLNANRIEVDSPSEDHIEDGSPHLQLLQTEPQRAWHVKTGLPYDKRVNRQSVTPRRKHTVQHSLASHIKRSRKGSRRVKRVKTGHRHVRHELLRNPSNKGHLNAGLPRITLRTSLQHTRRVRTQIKRSTKRP